MREHLLLVGEVNPYGGDDSRALIDYPEGCAGHRLRRILGLPRDDYRALRRTNLCRGDWDGRAARERAREILSSGRVVVVMLGRKVAQAFGFRGEFFTRTDAHVRGFFDGKVDYCLASLPHPSGRCLIWNRSDSAIRARDLLRGIAPDVAWGSES